MAGSAAYDTPSQRPSAVDPCGLQADRGCRRRARLPGTVLNQPGLHIFAEPGMPEAHARGTLFGAGSCGGYGAHDVARVRARLRPASRRRRLAALSPRGINVIVQPWDTIPSATVRCASSTPLLPVRRARGRRCLREGLAGHAGRTVASPSATARTPRSFRTTPGWLFAGRRAARLAQDETCTLAQDGTSSIS